MNNLDEMPIGPDTSTEPSLALPDHAWGNRTSQLTPPELETHRSRRKWKRLLIAGIVLSLAPLLGFIGTVVGMMISFDKIENMRAPTPGDLAVGVRWSLVSTTLGLVVGGIGISLAFWSYMKLRERPPTADSGPWR